MIYNRKYVTFFAVKSSALLLGITGTLKLISAFQSIALLRYRDPVFTILTNRQLMLCISIVEVSIAVALFWPRFESAFKGAMVLSFSLSCFCYRLWKIINNIPSPCRCLGNVGD